MRDLIVLEFEKKSLLK